MRVLRKHALSSKLYEGCINENSSKIYMSIFLLTVNKRYFVSN